MSFIITLIDALDRPGGHNLITIVLFLLVPLFYHTSHTLGDRLFDCCLTLIARNMVGQTLTAAKDRMLTEAAKGTGNGATMNETTTIKETKA